jgi:CHAT domain
MSSEIQIRVVNVEFLRPGPAHNQLLSPLTQYLALCNNSNAGVVTLPYEHARFERKLIELQYGAGGEDDLRSVLEEIGEDVGKILGAVPGLPGALTLDPSNPGPGLMIHLRLTLSASELALIPFELARVPISATAASDAWLAIQTRPPVSITRSVRTVSPEAVDWPRRPRILFVAAGKDDVPYKEHRDALLDAIAPFQYPKKDAHIGSFGDRREQFENLLTILLDPTLDDIRREWRDGGDSPYTHIHVLAHGIPEGREYGLALKGEGEAVDVVSGERFANAITCVSERGVHRPSVVTLASCDGGHVGSVMVPAANLAHAVHQAGVPLVVASQFPLSKEGSQPVAAMYQGLLWGRHPLMLLQQLRAELHARYATSYHDWASLVVYEALPRAMNEKLDALRYSQARCAINAALEKVDQAVQRNTEYPPGIKREDVLEASVTAARGAVERLPLESQYGVECIGLRASARKRLAQAAHTFILHGGGKSKEMRVDPYDLLEEARQDYELAVRGLLVNELGAVQRIATLHWVLVQAVSLAVILGKEEAERTEEAWKAAKLAADLYQDHSDPQERAWAHGSLAELWLLRLADQTLSDADRAKSSDNALRHVRELVRLYPDRTSFPVVSTCKQIARYEDWWGTQLFLDGLSCRCGSLRSPWGGPSGLLETAARMRVVLLGQPKPPGPAGGASPAGNTRSSAEPQDSTLASAAAPAGPAAPPTATGSPGMLVHGEGSARAPRPPRGPAPDGAFLTIEMLPARYGDCLWIEYGDASSTHRVLVDCGTEATAADLMARVARVPDGERFLELFVMTHVDADHIGGALPFFKEVKRGLRFGDVWFNGWKQISGMLGPKQGEMFTTAIDDFRLPLNEWRRGGPIVTEDDLPTHQLPGGLTLTLLSPTPAQLRKMAPVWVRELKKAGIEPGTRVDYSKFLKGRTTTSTDVDELADATFASDTAPANGTSIALLAEYGGAAVLLGADAHAPVLVDSIRRLLRIRGEERLKVDAFKLPHHGSQNNLSRPLLELLDCQRYLISTNGDHFFHPDRETIARVIKYGGKKPALCFNYSSSFNEVWGGPDLQEKYGYEAHYPAGGGAGLVTQVLPPES